MFDLVRTVGQSVMTRDEHCMATELVSCADFEETNMAAYNRSLALRAAVVRQSVSELRFNHGIYRYTFHFVVSKL